MSELSHRRALLARWAPPALLTVAAVPLSLYKLGAAPMWNDETASVAISLQHGQSFWSAVASDGGSMSAYYLLLHSLFFLGMGESATSVRLVSAVAYVAAVPFVYGLVRRCFGARVAVIATALVITDRTVTHKAQEARAYTMGLFLVVAATWVLISAVDRSSRSRWLAWAATSVLACYCLLLSPLFAAAQIMSVGTLRRRAGVMRSAALAAGLFAVMLVPLALLALGRGAGQIDWIAPISLASLNAELSELFVPRFPSVLAYLMLVVIVVGVLTVGRETAGSEPGSPERWHRVLLLCWAGFPLVATLLISTSVSLLQAGYLIAAIPAFAVLGAIGIKTVAGWTAERLVRASSALARGKSRRPRRETAMFGLSLVAVVAGIFVVIPFVVSWGAYGTVVQDGPAETAYIVGLTRAGDGIIFDQPPQRMIFDYYLFADFHQAARFPPLPAPIWPSAGWGTELPFAADHSVLTPAAISALDGRFTRIWVVDGGWKPLPKYVSQSQVMLHRLARKYPVVGETYFRGVKILLFSRSGPLPPGMKPWVGNG